MIFCGIGDEAGNLLTSQIEATKALRWKHIELRNVTIPGFPKANVHDLPAAAFDETVRLLEEAGITVHCFGSTIANWGKNIDDPWEITEQEVLRAIPRMQRLGTRLIRIMSYRVKDGPDQNEPERFRRLREVVRRFLDAGLQPVHENCMNFGGMSPVHALRLLENVPGLKWVFDTANPVFNVDHSKPEPLPRQDPWEFWERVRDQTLHLHVKDATWNPAKNDADYNWPGEGQGAVRRILADAVRRGYAGGLSIEPHMVAVFHSASAEAQDDALRANFVEYGHRLEALVGQIQRGAAVL
ncbi:MAG TPA: TIM barrel protein [Candidatus Limnocylindria bacterium]|jgi:sugar phosphate isomerase/epimerase|nr:TIM barrel protein [Candidatus Limnocylindria bacterium]